MANLDCLKDNIGLSTAGASGLALFNLPGMSADNFTAINDDVTDEEDTNLWNNIQVRSLRKMLTASLARINECYKINDLTVIDCLVCEKKELFATPLWYLLGAETMIERIYTDRVNRWTSIDLEEAKELLGYYTSQFENELQAAVYGLSPNESDCTGQCVECGGAIRFVEAVL